MGHVKALKGWAEMPMSKVTLLVAVLSGAARHKDNCIDTEGFVVGFVAAN